MKNRPAHLSIGDASIVLGMALLILSVIGLYFDTSTVQSKGMAGEQPGAKVIRRVDAPTSQAVVPLAQAKAIGTPISSPPSVPPAANPAAEVNNNSFLVPGTPLPTEAPPPEKLVPERIVIPAIGLDAVVLPAGYELVQIDGQVFQQWDAPNQYAAGWQQTSAFLGVSGNTILYGHHNIDGLVFAHLKDLNEGDKIEVYSGQWIFSYIVANKMILQERDEPLSVRLDNARWILPTTDERLTLVTCWPPDNNTHRVFIVARPAGKQLASSGQSP